MSATADRPASAAVAPRGPAPGPVRERAEGLELLGAVSGSGYKEGAALVRRADGQMVQLGPLMYALLEAIDGTRDDAALAAAMSERLGRRVEPEHVVRLGEKLEAQGLLAGSEEHAPPRLNPLLALRWKVLVTDPKITRRITAPFTPLFRLWFVLPLLAGFAAVLWFVLVHKGVASATAQAFHSPELLLLVLGLGVASAAFHEIGHASACRFGGARPGGMGAGIYLVWPAFYTDVTDAYRLPRGARLRTDLGGIYFNAVIAVITLGVWLAVRADALLLLVALQMLEIVKNLSPVIRSDGYHILSDATGVPDLYAHIGPTLRRLLPGRGREPSALTGRARLLVTGWVLVIVPVLLAMSLSAILVLPHLAASTWESGRHIAAGIPGQAGDGRILALLASLVRMFALALPVVGTVLMVGRLVRSSARRAHAWSAGRPRRQAALVVAAAALAALLAWAWWPSGQYQPVRATDHGTIQSIGRLVAAPAGVAVAEPAPAVAPAHLSAGRHLAVALIPAGGATREHPAIFVIKDRHGGGRPTVLVTDRTPGTRGTPTFTRPVPAGTGTTTATATATATPAPTPAVTATATPTAGTPAPQPATAFPFILPDKPGPHDSQALATNAQDGGVSYDVVYSIVTVAGGDTVDETNSAYALASCRACTTVAVSFQLVLIVGQSDVIKPIDVAEALNVNCPSCVTTAIADQIVVTLKAQPSDELVQRLTDELHRLDALPALGAGGSPSSVAEQVTAVQKDIEHELASSGLLANPSTGSTMTGGSTTTAGEDGSSVADGSARSTPSPTPSPGATSTPVPGATATPAPIATAGATATATPTPTTTPTASATPTATATPQVAATPSATP